MPKIAHIINPVKMPPQSDLYEAQPITFETMRLAKEFAAPNIEVELLTTQYPEDHSIIPSYFQKCPNLSRSVLDVGTFEKPRKLPILRDILQQLYEHSDAEYLVFTNVDIAVQPQFYSAIHQLMQVGNRALIINRRRVSGHYAKVEEIPLILSEVGKPHPGFDCFVFHRELFPLFELGDVCVGVPFIGITLAQNIFCFAEPYRLLRDSHLTLHVGEEMMKDWATQDYFQHNQRAFWGAMEKLMPKLSPAKWPFADRWLWNRMLTWGIHPSIQIRLVMKLESRHFRLFPYPRIEAEVPIDARLSFRQRLKDRIFAWLFRLVGIMR